MRGHLSLAILEAERVFSEKTTPISELVKGNPDRPMREPALVLLACLFNIFQVYQLFLVLSQLSIPYDPYNPYSWMSMIMLQLISGLVGWYIAFSIILLIGAAIVYFINRRIGSALILVISIIGLLVSFVSVGFTFIYTVSFIALITGLLAPVLGLLAGIYGVRSKESSGPSESQEVI
jgi:hypothetical protein